MLASRIVRLAALSGVLCCACSPLRDRSASAANSGGDGQEAGSRAAGAGGSAGTNDAAKQDAGEADRSGAAGASGRGMSESSAGAKSSSGEAGAAGSESGQLDDAGEPDTETPGSGGGSGNVEPTPGAVHGTLVDALRRPLANVELRIGDKTVSTDALGKFSVERMSETYDVSFKLTTTIDRTATTRAWRFVGLTRRDPTLQVYVAAEQQLANLTWHTQGPAFPLAANQRMLAGFGSPDGDFTAGVNAADYESPIVVWSGPAMTSGTTHGLLFTVSGAAELPLQYLAHDSKSIALNLGGEANASFDLSGTGLPTLALSGRVTAPGQGTRENWIVLRWSDGTSFLLGSESTPADAFSYLIPSLSDATAAVLAFRGRSDEFPMAVAYADKLAGGQPDIQLEVPAVPTLSAPGDGTAGVTGETEFKWTGTAKLFVFVARAKVGYDAMFVVTSAKSGKLPIGDATAFSPAAGAEFAWHVETHGDYASVDAATGSDGFIGSFFDGSYHGPRRGSGSFAASATRTFVTPP